MIRVVFTDTEFRVASSALAHYVPGDSRDRAHLLRIKSKLDETNEVKPVRFTNKEANVSLMHLAVAVG